MKNNFKCTKLKISTESERDILKSFFEMVDGWSGSLLSHSLPIYAYINKDLRFSYSQNDDPEFFEQHDNKEISIEVIGNFVKPDIVGQQILDYAEDLKNDVNTAWKNWERSVDCGMTWESLTTHPNWSNDVIHRRKQYIEIGNCRVKIPESKELDRGTKFFTPSLFIDDKMFVPYIWDGSDEVKKLLKCGLVHLDSQDAHEHSMALISLTHI